MTQTAKATSTQAAKARSRSPLRRFLTMVVFVAVIVIVITAVAGGGKSKTPKQSAQAYITGPSGRWDRIDARHLWILREYLTRESIVTADLC